MTTQHILRSLRTLLLFAILATSSLATTAAHAQNMGENPAIQDYGRPGMPRITIYVWGNAQTGVWTVEEGASMLEVVSATARVRLDQRSPERREVSYTADLSRWRP